MSPGPGNGEALGVSGLKWKLVHEVEEENRAAPHSLTAGVVALQHAGLALATSVSLAFSLVIVSIITTRELGVSGRGEVAAAVLIPTLLAYVGQMGIPVAVGYTINQNPIHRTATIATARTLSLAVSLPLCLLSALLIWFLPFEARVRIAGMPFTLYIPFSIFTALHSGILQADMRTKAFNMLRMTWALSYVGLVVFVISIARLTTMMAVLSQLISAMVAVVISIFLVSGRPWFMYDRFLAKELLSYGARAHLGTVQPVDTLRIDQLILSLFLSTSALGTYVIAMTFVAANRLIGTSIGMVAFPIASRGGQDKKSLALLAQLTGAAVILAVLAAIVEIALGQELLRWLFSVDSIEAYRVMTILIVGSVIMNIRQVISDILRGLGRPGLPTQSEILLLVSLLILSTLLWRNGLLGVATAVTASATIALLPLLYAYVAVSKPEG